MFKVIITGVNSFIGNYFKKNTNFEVSEIDLLENNPNEINFNNYNVIFHVAAIVHQDKSIPDKKYFEINSDLAVNVAKEAKNAGIKQFVFMSTVKVYGENSTIEAPWNEKSDCKPTDAYGKSKLDAEIRLLELNSKDFVVSVIRTPIVYGPGVKGNILKIAKFVNKQKFIPFKGIKNKRAMVYIGNLIALIEAVIKTKKSGIFLAGDSKLISTSELIELLIKSSTKKKYFIKFPKLAQQLIKLVKPNFYNRLFGSMVINPINTFEKLNFSPPYQINEGIKEIMQNIE